MVQSIRHKGETEANRIRRQADKYEGKGLRTYTPTQAVVSRAMGRYLWTVDDKRLVDFASGVLVTNLGHAHKRFEQLAREYRRGLPRSAYNMITAVEVEASARLVRSMRYPKAQKVLWAASGSEGIQKAMWCALHRYPDRPIMLGTRGGFHGKKGLASDVTGDRSDNRNVRLISFPLHEPESPEFYRRELDELAKKHKDKIALLITEPYLGAKGSFHPPAWYHRLLQEWCEKNGVVFIFDEVQSCHGRTGSMYAYQTYGVEPDLVVLGKGVANGEPAAAVVGRADLIDALDYGEASDTFSANPGAAAAVCATFDVFKEEKIVRNCKKMGKIMRKRLEGLTGEFPFVKYVRGEGLVYGVEMTDAETANRCVLEAYRGTGKKGVHFLGPLADKVLRVSPPLTITEKELDEAFAILRKAWRRV